MTGPGSSPSGPDLAEFYEYAIGLARTLRNTAGRGATKREEGEFAYAVEFLQRYDTEEARDAVVGDRPRDRGGDPAGPRDLPRVGAPGPVPQLVAPDLAALREKAEAVIEHPSAATVREWWDERENLSAESLLAVLSLVDDLRAEVARAVDVGAAWQNARDEVKRELDRVRAENERLRKGLTRLRDYGALTDEFVRVNADSILAGSPAANDTKEGGS